MRTVCAMPPASHTSGGRPGLRGLERHVELRAVADAVELDPVGVRQPLVAVARGRRRPRQQLGPRCPTRPAPGSRSARRRGASPRGARSVDQRRAPRRSAATPRIWWASSSAGMCSKRVAMSPRRAAPALRRGDDRLGVRRRAPSASSCIVAEVASVSRNESSPSAQPPAGASATTVRARRARRAAARRSRRASCRRGAPSRSRRRPSRARPPSASARRSTSPSIGGRRRARRASARARRAGARAPAARAPRCATCR